MNTGHPSAALVIMVNLNISYLNPSSRLKFITDRKIKKVDRTEFESVTPRVQGGYTTRLYYRPTEIMPTKWILIVASWQEFYLNRRLSPHGTIGVTN